MTTPVVLLLSITFLAILLVLCRSWWNSRKTQRFGKEYFEMVEQFGVPYRPAERFFAELSPKLQNQLNQIEPTPDPDMIMYPCRVKMKNGDGPILVEDVVDIQESPYRMPTRFAKLLYDAGEASMGSWRYTANFRDGSERAYYNNDLVFDFIAAPAGMTNKDIISVEPHVTRATTRRERGRALEYRWCLHGHGKPSPVGLSYNN